MDLSLLMMAMNLRGESFPIPDGSESWYLVALRDGLFVVSAQDRKARTSAEIVLGRAMSGSEPADEHKHRDVPL